MKNTDVRTACFDSRSVYNCGKTEIRDVRGGRERTPREESIFREDGDGVDEKDGDWGGLVRQKHNVNGGFSYRRIGCRGQRASSCVGRMLNSRDSGLGSRGLFELSPYRA